jgi:hypothetical protein
MIQRVGCLSVALLLSFTAACSGSDGPDEPLPPADDGVCADDTSGETYAAGMTFDGKKGLTTVTLEEASPAPPVASQNTWTIAITDAAGAPVVGATLTVEPFMKHGGSGHGTAAKVVVSELGDGRYLLSNVYLNMVGSWITTIGITAGSTTDEVQIGFCVE